MSSTDTIAPASGRFSLYLLALGPASKRYNEVVVEKNVIPTSILLDIYLQIAEKDEKGHLIRDEVSQLDTFTKLLQVKNARDKLHKVLKILINTEISELVCTGKLLNTKIPEPQVLPIATVAVRLADNFERHSQKTIDDGQRKSLLRNGVMLGEFLCEAGWYKEGGRILCECMCVCLAKDNIDGYQEGIKCLEKFLAAQISFCMHEEARVTYATANEIIGKLKDAEVPVNFAGLYSAFSSMFYLECRYRDALEWSVKALEELKKDFCRFEPSVIVDILRQAAKSCVVRREFHKAELLMKEAVYLSRDIYGSKSIKHADTLLDYGYYLLNRDSVQQAVEVYRECLEIRNSAYGRYNILTAIAMEDLSYALYVKEYSTGCFEEARHLSEKAIGIMNILLPPNHLQLASVKRVTALILEEIAIDSHGGPNEKDLLKEAEELHLQALKLSKKVFGEMNVHIAKHYGNLGRLYQSMRKYTEAEAMHVKAITIKETLLGLYDYEVALSVGHLASLYNYDMEQYRKAEELHIRSINIGRRLFGDAYSGLEYDYRGLLQIYSLEANHEKFHEYSQMYTQWRMLRDLKAANGNDRPISETQIAQPVSKVIGDFFIMKWINAEN